MRLSPTRALRPPETPVLVYDGECPFCTRTAHWTQDHARSPLRILTFEEVEGTGLLTRLSEEELFATAHYVTPSGIEYHGGEAITRVLRHVPFGWVAGVLNRPGLSLLRDAGYVVVDRTRPLLSKVIHP